MISKPQPATYISQVRQRQYGYSTDAGGRYIYGAAGYGGEISIYVSGTCHDRARQPCVPYRKNEYFSFLVYFEYFQFTSLILVSAFQFFSLFFIYFSILAYFLTVYLLFSLFLDTLQSQCMDEYYLLQHVFELLWQWLLQSLPLLWQLHLLVLQWPLQSHLSNP